MPYTSLCSHKSSLRWVLRLFSELKAPSIRLFMTSADLTLVKSRSQGRSMLSWKEAPLPRVPVMTRTRLASTTTRVFSGRIDTLFEPPPNSSVLRLRTSSPLSILSLWSAILVSLYFSSRYSRSLTTVISHRQSFDQWKERDRSPWRELPGNGRY